MQALHMSFGIGALITPLIASHFYLPLSQSREESADIPVDLNSTGEVPHDFLPEDVRIQWAYMIVGVYTLLNGAIFGYYFLTELGGKSSDNSVKDTKDETPVEIPTWKKYTAVATVAILAHIAFGVEFILGWQTQNQNW